MKKTIKRENLIKLPTGILALALALSLVSPAAFAQTEERMLVPMGNTVGIQIHTDGVMVVGLSATQDGALPSPAAMSGLVPGDIITALGGDKVSCAEDFRACVEKLDGSPVSVSVLRGGETLQFTIEPQMGPGGAELGVWLRDTISGIGTLTYYDPETGSYGGLGHSINDVDSGVIMPLGHGEIMRSSVSGIIKGISGSPGELCGTFDLNSICGTIKMNTGSGIFGELQADIPSADKAIPMGRDKDISLGKATIISNIAGVELSEFEIEIVRVYRGDEANRSMMIKVTDERLLEQTGGIVQGMSGSPVIQNGKLIGAVTHVMINDPTSGFAVTVEKMLEASAA